ncbi:RagB/SusD family nutrient uptake outer membrane protein [Halosquirtibacter laminarini]|uniref:RagB/SusD family nutrient uptake outer membrane protein n=1 Tax=Halosquirtibacter laminarini TaxID=3374600 RepID=A0AC61NCZ3_9BACT|nr:RagB/SusD family nutrient uptake outer membrane protein [Prolixibacteraceae bacterium]
MKKNILTLALGATLLGGAFSSCDLLEEDSSVIIETKTYFKQESELVGAITPIYNYIFKDNTRFGGISGRGFSLNCGDPALTSIRGLNKQRMLEFDDFNVSENNDDITAVWKAMYRAIGAANNVISSRDRIEKIAMDATKREVYMAEAHFLRALAYYNIVSYWGKGPIVEKLLTGDEAKLVKNATAEEIYNFIIADLEIAKVIPEERGELGRVNQDAVRMLKAYVYMNMAGYPLNKGNEYYKKAADAAAEVISTASHSLDDNFADLWKADNRFKKSEHIFFFYGNYDLGRDLASYGGKGLRGTEEGGWKDYVVETEFYNNFPNDNRKKETIYDVIKFNKKGLSLPESKYINCLDAKEKHTWVGKYRDLGGSPWKDVTTNTIYPVFRYADALLILAEADNLANGGPTPRAYDALRRIQHRAYDGTAEVTRIIADGATMDSFDKVVLQERMWEFAFENKTWITMVRRQKVEEFNKNHDKEVAGFSIASITESDYFFPIPEHETLINSNLK